MESAVRPPSAHDPALEPHSRPHSGPQCNGVNEDSGSETSSYSEPSGAHMVTVYLQLSVIPVLFQSRRTWIRTGPGPGPLYI